MHRHEWNALSAHRDITLSMFESLETNGEATCVQIVAAWDPTPDGLLFLAGHVGMVGRVVVTFAKYLELRDRYVRTISYSYNCHVQRHGSGGGVFGNFLRYDNAHGRNDEDTDTSNALVTWHHRHEWDPPDRTGAFGGKRTWIGDADWPSKDWPHLGEVVREARRWCLDNNERFQLGTQDPDLARCHAPDLSPPVHRIPNDE